MSIPKIGEAAPDFEVLDDRGAILLAARKKLVRSAMTTALTQIGASSSWA